MTTTKKNKIEKKTEKTIVQSIDIDTSRAALDAATTTAAQRRGDLAIAIETEAEALRHAVDTDSPTDWTAHETAKTRAARCRLRSEAADAEVEKIRTHLAGLERAILTARFADAQRRTGLEAVDAAISEAVENRAAFLVREQEEMQRMGDAALAAAVAQDAAVDEMYEIGPCIGRDHRELDALKLVRATPYWAAQRIDELARAKVAALESTEATAVRS
jgi:hypothetical protein